MSTLSPFINAHKAVETLKKLGVSIQEVKIFNATSPVIRCDYTPTLNKLHPVKVGVNAAASHMAARLNGVSVMWDEPLTVSRVRTLRRVLAH